MKKSTETNIFIAIAIPALALLWVWLFVYAIPQGRESKIQMMQEAIRRERLNDR